MNTTVDSNKTRRRNRSAHHERRAIFVHGQPAPTTNGYRFMFCDDTTGERWVGNDEREFNRKVRATLQRDQNNEG